MLKAGCPDSTEFETALARLCEDYHPPLQKFARGWMKSPEEADDLTQGFFAHFIKNNVSGAVTPEKGRFRNFLLASFKNYKVSVWRKENRAKDIPSSQLSSINEEREDGSPVIEPSTEPVLERQLDVAWAQTIQSRVLKEMARDYEKRKKALFFRRLGCLLLGQEVTRPYTELAEELQMSIPSLKTSVSRMRDEFRGLFRSEVAETVFDGDEVDDECRYLLRLLFNPSAPHSGIQT